MRDFFKKHVMLEAVAALLASEVLIYGMYFATMLLRISFGTTNGGYFIREILLKVIPSLVIAFCFGTLHTFRQPFRGLGKSFLSGAYMLTLSVLGSCVMLSEALKQGQSLKNIREIIFYVLFLLMVGLSEELLLRGTILRLMLDHYGTKGWGMVISVIVSSALFGACHFTNLFRGQGLYNTVLQMAGTFMMGMLLGAIYAKRGNLYGVIILHAAIDFMTICEQGLLSGRSLAEVHTSSERGSLFWTLVSNGTFLIAASIVMLHKKKSLHDASKYVL